MFKIDTNILNTTLYRGWKKGSKSRNSMALDLQ